MPTDKELSKRAKELDAQARKLREQVQANKVRRKKARLAREKKIKPESKPFRANVSTSMTQTRNRLGEKRRSWHTVAEHKKQQKKFADRLACWESVHEAFLEIMFHLDAGNEVKIWTAGLNEVRWSGNRDNVLRSNRRVQLIFTGFERFEGEDRCKTMLRFTGAPKNRHSGFQQTAMSSRSAYQFINLLLAPDTEYQLL